MTDAQRRTAAKEFAAQWAGKGYEKGQSQSFWLSFLRDVYGVEHPETFITFEDQIMLDHTSFIDGFIPDTRRKGGMHYTSIENIHKVIDPLFLDSLRDELAQIQEITVEKTRMAKLKAFQAKLAGLTFLEIKTRYLIQRNAA